jgi:hypothetical protein
MTTTCREEARALYEAGRDLQVTGRIAIGQLDALVRIEAVRYVVRSGAAGS